MITPKLFQATDLKLGQKFYMMNTNRECTIIALLEDDDFLIVFKWWRFSKYCWGYEVVSDKLFELGVRHGLYGFEKTTVKMIDESKAKKGLKKLYNHEN